MIPVQQQKQQQRFSSHIWFNFHSCSLKLEHISIVYTIVIDHITFNFRLLISVMLVIINIVKGL